METLERSWSPRSQADPLAALWIAATAPAATDSERYRIVARHLTALSDFVL